MATIEHDGGDYERIYKGKFGLIMLVYIVFNVYDIVFAHFSAEVFKFC